MMQHEQAWITLAEILGPRSPWLRPMLERFHTPEGIFEAGESALREAFPDLAPGLLRAILSRRGADAAGQIYLWCHRNSVRVLALDSADYPECLRALDEPPAVLYCRGTLPELTRVACVGVVGSRRTDAYGEGVAYKLSFELAAANTVIVSGMADGIDGIATAAALSAGGKVIAVLGCGIDIAYPKHHAKLMRECAESGAVITEYPPGTPPNGYHFPVRNRLISALSDAVLVIQAPERSGALITARYAVMQGRMLYAVPGEITSPVASGTNRLLQAGARPALCSEDILAPLRARYRDSLLEDAFCEAMQYSELNDKALVAYGVRSLSQKEAKKRDGGTRKAKKEEKKASVREKAPAEGQQPRSEGDLSALTPRQREIFALIPDTRFSVDVLVQGGIPVAEAISTLTVLEIYGLLASEPGGFYVKNLF